MDYYNSMKRRELQALCKKHNIPANSANSVLVEKLSKLLNEQEKKKPITRRRTCMKSPVEATDEGEPRQAKKVRFSPNNDLVEYQLRSGRKQTPVATKSKARRKSVAMKADKSVDDNNSIDDGAQAPSRRAVKGTNVDKEPEGKLRVTRSKVHTLANGNAIQPDENKQSIKSVKDVKKRSESVEVTVIGRVRVTRSKAQASSDDGTGPDINPQVEKKRGRQVARDVQNVEPSNELGDIPARVTRSRGQTVEDINSVVSNPEPEKKRTRKEMKATGQSSMALKDKEECPKRKSLRTRGPKEIDEDQGDKAEVANVSRTTRSKAGLAVKSSGRNSKSKAANKNVVQQLEEPLKNAGRKNVKRRDVAPEDKQELLKRKLLRTRGVENLDEDEADKVEVVNGGRATRSKAHLAVKASGRNGETKTEKIVVVQQLEEPSKHAGRKNVNHRKSVMPPENSKVVLHLDEPVNRPNRNARGNSVLQKTQGKVISKAEMVGSPTAGKKQSKGKSAKVASDDEMKAANASGSPKSRKRRGTLVIEDQTIGTEYVSHVDESARISTHSASKTEGKSVANNQPESSVKTPTSGIRNQSALKGAFSEENQRGTSQTVRSSATIRGDSSNKRAKLSVPKQSDSEYHAVKSTEGGTPVSKLVSFQSGKEGVEIEFTPAIDGSCRWLTRSAIRSDKNEVGSIFGKIDAREPTQTTNKKQCNEDVQLSSGKPGKFRPNRAVNTAPVRVTRSGIKHGGDASCNYSDKVDKKKPTRSVHQIQPLEDAQISLPKVAEVGPSPDNDTIGVQSEDSTAVTGGILGNLVNLQRPSSVAEVTETSSDAISDGSHVQNNVKSIMYCEVELQVAVSSEKSVPNEMESTEIGSVSKELQRDAMVEESVVSIGKAVIMEDGVGAFLGDAANKCDSSSYDIDSYAVYLESFEQSDVKGKLEEDEGHVEPSSIGGVDSRNEVADNGESDDVEDDIDDAHDNLDEHNELSTAGKFKEDEGHVEPSNIEGVYGVNEIADNGETDDVEDKTDAAHDSLAKQNDLPTAGKLREDGEHVEPPNIEGVDGGNEVADNGESDDVEDDIDAVYDSLAEQNELSTGENISYGLPIDRCDVADVVDDAGNELAKELEADVVPSPCNDVHKSPIVSKSDDEHASPIQGIYDDEDGSVDATKGCETDECVNTNKEHMHQDPVLSDGDGDDEGVDTNNKHESNLKWLTDNDVSDTSLLGKNDGFDMTKQPEPTSELSSASDIIETPFSDNDISVVDPESHLKPQNGNDVFDSRMMVESDVKGDTINVPKKLETGLEPLNAYDTLEFHVSGDEVDREYVVDDKSDGQDGKSEYEQLTSNDSPATDEQYVGGDDLEPDDTENMLVVTEALITSSDQEPEPESNIAIDRETCYTAGVCEPVSPSDSSTSIEASPAPSTSGNGVASVTVDALELETGLEPSNAYNTLEVHVAGDGADPEYAVDDKSDGQDGKSELEQFTSNASSSTDGQYVGDDDLENKETCYTAGVCDSVRPSDSSTTIEASPAPATSENDVASVTVDALEESSRNIYKDAVSNIFGEIHGLGNTIEVTDTKNDSGNERIIIGTSGLNEGLWSKESASVSPDMKNALMTEEAKTTIEIDNTSTSDHGLDGGNFMDGCSSLGVGELHSQLAGNRTTHTSTGEEGLSILYTKECNLSGDIEVHENPITEESSPITSEKEEFSKSPVFAKEDDRNKQEETLNPNSYAALESYSFAMDEQNPVLATRSDVLDRSIKDDRVSDVATSAGASSSIEESSMSAADLVDSVKNMDKTSRNMTDGKSIQEVDMMKENSNPDITEEIFNWNDSSLKSFSTTPAASQINHLKDGREDAANFANQDHYSPLNFLYTTPAIATISHAKGIQDDAVNLTNQSCYLSLKPLFATPATTTTSHVKGGEADTIGFAFSDSRCNEDIGINQSAAPGFNHQWENEPSEVFNGETIGNTTNNPENEMHGVLSFEAFTNKLFEDEDVDGSGYGSGKNKKCEVNGDHYDFWGQAAGTGDHEAPGSKDNMINSDM